MNFTISEPDRARLNYIKDLRDRIAWQSGVIKLLLVTVTLLSLALLVRCDRPQAAAGQPNNLHDPVMAAKISAAADYIAKVNPEVDTQAVATELVHASFYANLEPGFWLLVALARYESTFRPDAVGRAGERGLLQVHPVHFRAMRKAGLDPAKHADCTLWGALMVASGLSQGKSLSAAVAPWIARSGAIRLYRQLVGAAIP